MDDPNADLIGFSFGYEGSLWTVTGSAEWNSAYVEVEQQKPWGTPGRSVRPAGNVRRMKHLTEQTDFVIE